MGIIQKQGIQNTIITYLGIIIGFVNLIIIQPFLLSKEEVGLIRVLFSFSSLVAVIVPLGITNITIRYFPVFRNKEKGHYGFLGFILIFPLVGGIIIFCLLTIFKQAIIGQYIENSKLFTDYFNYILPLSVFLGFISVLNTFCFSLFETTVPSILNDIVNKILTIVVISIYFLKWIDLDWFIFLYVSIFFLQLSLLMVFLFKIDTLNFKVDRVYLKEKNVLTMLRYGFLLSFASLAGIGMKFLDSIMIGKYMHIEFVGIYSIVAFIPTVIEAPLYSLDKIAYTKLSQALTNNNHEEVKEIYYKSSRYLFLIGGALFLLVNVNIADLLSFLPKDYSKGINVVLIISIGTLINMAGGSNGSIIFSSKYYKLGGYLLIFLAVMAFCLNMLFIPRWGIEGAAVATSFTIFVFALMRYLIIYIGFKLQPLDNKMFKILVLLIIGMALNYLLPSTQSSIINIAYRSTIILGTYILGTYYLKIIPEFHSYIPIINKKPRDNK